MRVGMLWFDDSYRPMYQKVQGAVEHHRRKHGRAPEVCVVNDQEPFMPDPEDVGLEVRKSRLVLPGHFWVGVDTDD